MNTAIEFLIWEVNQSNLRGDILDKIKQNNVHFNTNTTDISIDYNKQNVVIYNVSQTAETFLQEFSLGDFINLIEG